MYKHIERSVAEWSRKPSQGEGTERAATDEGGAGGGDGAAAPGGAAAGESGDDTDASVSRVGGGGGANEAQIELSLDRLAEAPGAGAEDPAADGGVSGGAEDDADEPALGAFMPAF